MLADSAREQCRRTIEADFVANTIDESVMSPDVETNCSSYTAASVTLAPAHAIIASEDPPDHGALFTVAQVCSAVDLFGNDISPFGGTDGDSDPDHPLSRSVACGCEIEQVGPCGQEGHTLPADTTIEAKFCVPEGGAFADMPAAFCREQVADYYNAAVRLVNYNGSIGGDPACGDFGPGQLDVVVRCAPKDMGDMDFTVDGPIAFLDQEDLCHNGCGSIDCGAISGACTAADATVLNFEPPTCAPNTLGDTCDCDVIASACFEGNAGASVCLPEEDGNGDGGADGGADGGGGGPSRLKSAITLLQGDWISTGCASCSVLDLSPGSLTHAPVEAPTSGMAPIVLYNGTTFASGIQLACEAPSADEVSLATLDISLAELCDLIPSCAYADDLSVTLTAREGSQLVAQGSLTKTGGIVSTTDEGAALGLGDHLLDLCLTESSSGLQFCGSQPVRVSAPLGSGADTFGHFAGEVAGDFIALSGRPGAQALTVGDNGTATVSLPSGFTFDFYAEGPVSVLTVGANGGIRIGTGTIASANTTLPSSPNTQAPNIAVYWDDLDPSASGEVLTWFDGQRFIVSWEGVAHGRDAGSSIGDISVQAHLYEDGRIEFHYADTEIGISAYDKGRSATIGIQNSARTDAVLVSFNSNTLLGGGTTGLRFETGDCFGSNLEIPPEVGCFAEDLFTTACVPSGGMVSIPAPDVSECAPEGGLVVGTVIESGQTEAQLEALRTPKSIVGGQVQLNAGAHLIQYRVVDSAGVDMAPYFYRLVLVEGWAHGDCGGSGRTLSILSSGDDTYDSSANPEAVCVMGKEGDDFVASGPSSDFLVGGLDAGVCEGNDGDDFLLGEAGDDTLDGGNGNDQIWGGVGDDLLLGANGSDTLECEGGNDIATGGNGDDIVWGGSGDDVLDGDGGDDVIYPGSGVDIVDGGAGDDTIVVLDACELTPGTNLSGGEGTDELVLPEGMTLQDVVAAGVTVNADIESVTTSDSLPTYRTECG